LRLEKQRDVHFENIMNIVKKKKYRRESAIASWRATIGYFRCCGMALIYFLFTYEQLAVCHFCEVVADAFL